MVQLSLFFTNFNLGHGVNTCQWRQHFPFSSLPDYFTPNSPNFLTPKSPFYIPILYYPCNIEHGARHQNTTFLLMIIELSHSLPGSSGTYCTVHVPSPLSAHVISALLGP